MYGISLSILSLKYRMMIAVEVTPSASLSALTNIFSSFSIAFLILSDASIAFFISSAGNREDELGAKCSSTSSFLILLQLASLVSMSVPQFTLVLGFRSIHLYDTTHSPFLSCNRNRIAMIL